MLLTYLLYQVVLGHFTTNPATTQEHKFNTNRPLVKSISCVHTERFRQNCRISSPFPEYLLTASPGRSHKTGKSFNIEHVISFFYNKINLNQARGSVVYSYTTNYTLYSYLSIHTPQIILYTLICLFTIHTPQIYTFYSYCFLLPTQQSINLSIETLNNSISMTLVLWMPCRVIFCRQVFLVCNRLERSKV